MAIPKDNTDLGRSSTLLGELADLVDNLVGGGLEPRRRVAGVGDGGGRNSLALAVEATHLELFVCRGVTCAGYCRRLVEVGVGCEKFTERKSVEGRWSVGHVSRGFSLRFFSRQFSRRLFNSLFLLFLRFLFHTTDRVDLKCCGVRNIGLCIDRYN